MLAQQSDSNRNIFLNSGYNKESNSKWLFKSHTPSTLNTSEVPTSLSSETVSSSDIGLFLEMRKTDEERVI